MAEKITFEFEGRLADQHKLNFYEAARFQYAAARLLVKLSQFRSTGKFRQKITNLSNVGVTLETQEEGSFRINVDAPEPVDVGTDDGLFVNLTLTDLLAYVSERVIAKSDDAELIALFNAHTEIVRRFGQISEADNEKIEEIVRSLIDDPELRALMYPETSELVERRVSELGRGERLMQSRGQIARIDGAREQKLISMAAPLITEMATALRKSADTLNIRSESRGVISNVFFLNQSMAFEIESTKVDQEITPILGNIIQYNKETGWGKVRLSIATQPLSFSVPSDQKSSLQEILLSQMGRDQVYLQIYIVRDRAREPVRVIIAGILPLPD